MIIRLYSEQNKDEWNEFNRTSKNPLFMFDRNYMDYHKERFKDHSLLFYDEEKLVAILPMSIHDNVLVSHGGLTYGGMISGDSMKQHTMNECFDALKVYARMNSIKRIRYKAIPHIYHAQPAEEDRYALYANGGRLVTIDASTYINLSSPLKMSKGRRSQISRAKREDVTVHVMESYGDYKEFIELENSILKERHNTSAVHSAEELKMLHDRFPDNIHLYLACRNHNTIAGAVVFEYENVVHTQYMAANEEARAIGALDLTVYSIIERYKNKKKWLDFGISTEHDRIYLNEGLIAQKESFGGRTGVYAIWELPIEY